MTLFPPLTATSEINREQLELIAQNFSIERDDVDFLEKACFERLFQICREKKWALIQPICQEVVFLINDIAKMVLRQAALEEVDPIGHTWTVEAVMTKALLIDNVFEVMISIGQQYQITWEKSQEDNLLDLRLLYFTQQEFLGNNHVKNLLNQAERGQDDQVDHFIDSCRNSIEGNRREMIQRVNLLTYLGDIYANLNRYEKAIDVVNTMFHLATHIRGSEFELIAKYHLKMGMLHVAIRKYEKGEAFFTNAIRVCEESGNANHPFCSSSYSERASLYLIFGQLRKAEDDCRKLLNLAENNEPLFSPYFLLETLTRLGSILFKENKFREAGYYFEKAFNLSIEKKSMEHPQGKDIYIEALGGYGKCLLSVGKGNEAIPYMQNALDLLEIGKGHQINVINTLIDLGNAWMSQGNSDEALAFYIKAHHISENSHNVSGDIRRSKAISAAALGGYYLEREDFENVIQWSRNAVQIFTEIQEELSRSDWQVTIFEQQARAFRQLEYALIKTGRLDEALMIADKRRSRVLVKILSKRVLPEGDPSLDFSLSEIFELARKQKTTFVVYSTPLLEGLKGWCWVISSDRPLSAVEINMGNVFPDGVDGFLSEAPYRGRLEEQSLPIADLYREFSNLAEGTDELSLIGLPYERSDKEKEEIKAERMQKLLQKFRSRFDTQLKRWYKDLIEPVKHLLPPTQEETVTFIPDGLMGMLPFAAFKKEDGECFINDYACLIAPSMKTVSLLGELKRQREILGFSGESLVIGNPTTLNLVNLKYAKDESERVKEFLGTSQDHLMMEENATLSRVLPLMEKAQWIHFACHGSYDGKIDPYSIYSGSLHFTPEIEHPEGKLFGDMIASMELEAELVFISACHSGRGNTEYIHEGLVGLTRALASSGVLTSASSYWRLPDTPEIVEMVTTFYRHVMDGKGKAYALREAMLKAIHDDNEATEKWGAFFLSGLN